MISQIRRAATSIGLNIAEGRGRKTDKEFVNFLSIVFGSCSEVEYVLLLSKDLDYISEDKHQELYNKLSEIKRMLTALIRKVTK